MTKPGRIPCVVPYCGRTAKRLPQDTDETVVICGPHHRLADPKLRRLSTLALRRFNRVYSKYKVFIETNETELAQEMAKQCNRYCDIHAWLFERIKKQAIERAMGITA